MEDLRDLKDLTIHDVPPISDVLADAQRSQSTGPASDAACGRGLLEARQIRIIKPVLA